MSAVGASMTWRPGGLFSKVIPTELSRTAFAQGTTIVPIVVGTIVLLGWAVDSLPLKTLILGGDNPVRPNTAAAVLLLGLGLLISLRGGAFARRFAAVVYVFVGVVAGLTILEYVLALDFGIDEALFRAGPELTVPFPARMAFSSAVGLLLVSMAGLSAVTPRLGRLTVPLASVAATIAGLMILGHLYNAEEMTTGFSAGVGIAVPTAVSLVFLAAGVLARPGVGRTFEVLGRKSPGGELARVLFGASVILLPTVGFLRGLGEEAGLYGMGFGLSITVGVSVALLTVVAVVLGQRLDLAEAARRQAEQEFLRVIELTDDAICIIGPDGRFRELNPAWATLLGYDIDDLRSRPFIDFVHPDDVERTMAEWDATLRQGRTAFHFVNRYRHVDGTHRSIEWVTRIDPDSGNVYSVARDVTTRTKLERERALLSAIIESTDEAVISTDPDGLIRSWNPAATGLFGHTELEALGQPMTILVPPEREEEAAERLEQTRNGANVEDWETVRMTRDGRRVPVMITLSPLRDDGGRLIGESTITRDITELKASRDRLELANKTLAGRNAELRDFSSVVSHDLRAPLRRLQLFAEMAVEAPGKDPEVAELLERIRASADRMETLVVDLLNYARVGRSGTGMQAVDLSAVVGDALDEHHSSLMERHMLVEVGRLPTVEGDAILLRQVFSNLIGNAIKFASREHPPVVLINASDPADDDRGRSFVEVSVTDNGIGFDPTYADRIFRIFERLTTDQAGTGVGLAICRKITDLHEGTIEATSEPGHGATFKVRLPVEQTKEPRDV